MNDRLDRLSKEEHTRILKEVVIPESGLDALTSQEHPKAIVLAGQPGAGKGSLARAARRELDFDVLVVDPDSQREYHPESKRWQRESPYSGSQRTNSDAGAWAGELREQGVAHRVNLIIDTTLGDARSATRMIQGLQKAGYEVEVRAIAAHSLESEHGVDERFTKDIDAKGSGRHVPEEYRQRVCRNLPDNLNQVTAETGTPIRIFNREGAELYDSRIDSRPPGQVMEEERAARIRDPKLTQSLRDGWKEQQTWHRDLPETLPNNRNVDPATRENLLAERSANHVVESVERTAREAVDVDHIIRVRPARIHAGTALGVAGLALEAYDAADTVRTAIRLRNEGNATAAESELIHFGARTIGGWAGAGIGMVAAAAAASSV